MLNEIQTVKELKTAKNLANISLIATKQAVDYL
jgi:hypothetical protein